MLSLSIVTNNAGRWQCEDYKHAWHVMDMCVRRSSQAWRKRTGDGINCGSCSAQRGFMRLVNSSREWWQISVQLSVGERVPTSNINRRHLIGHTECRTEIRYMCRLNGDINCTYLYMCACVISRPIVFWPDGGFTIEETSVKGCSVAIQIEGKLRTPNTIFVYIWANANRISHKMRWEFFDLLYS